MPTPIPTPIYRIIHIDNLELCLTRGGLHAPNTTPNDGLAYRTIHSQSVQTSRSSAKIDCGPGGNIHDYVPFYFGRLSVMLLNLKTGRVQGYTEGQEPIIYLVSTCQAVATSGAGFVFTDMHSLATYASPYDDLSELGAVDWDLVNERYWSNTPADNDRQTRKQAEFLVHGFCDWGLIDQVVVIDQVRKTQALEIMEKFPAAMHRPVVVTRDWYYW
jgi:hypothetical protein